MAGYPYRPDLPAPPARGTVDPGDARMAPMLRVMAENLRAQARGFSPPAGVKMRLLQLPAWDGGSLDCFVLEPQDAKEPLPGMVYCHGGGFFLPVQPTALQLAALYAQALEMRAFLPEYRLLPDYASPYPFRDCLSAWQAICTEAGQLAVDPCRMLLYGESAGGALAAGLALWLRDHEKKQTKGQLLVYPVLDNRCSRYPSMVRYSQAAWTLGSNLAMWKNYLRDGDQDMKPYLIPMQAETVDGLPAAYIEPQEIDILRDEGIAYARRLEQAGCPVRLQVVEGSYHGFDADTANPFVRRIIGQRTAAMEWMLGL